MRSKHNEKIRAHGSVDPDIFSAEVSVFAEDAGGDSDSRSKTVTLTAK